MMRDRITSLRIANYYNLHTDRHLVSNVDIVGMADGVYDARANYAVIPDRCRRALGTVLRRRICRPYRVQERGAEIQGKAGPAGYVEYRRPAGGSPIIRCPQTGAGL